MPEAELARLRATELDAPLVKNGGDRDGARFFAAAPLAFEDVLAHT